MTPQPATPRPVERFPALDAIPGVRAAFLTRIPAIDAAADRETALARLQPAHQALVSQLGFAPPIFAEQVHNDGIAIVAARPAQPVAGADGLATATPGLTLGIHVADCAAVFLVDPRRRAVALVHSGRKGTELNILRRAVDSLREAFATDPADLVAVVSPCIRPPAYEVDFAATIAAQARAMGISAFYDDGICTASHPARYYSYRRELGRTGRMLALLSLVP
ncbi:MAG: polyphenol oxidase family protein [Terrimicrobiaceae bacterium]|nr:polyphenol oxidase family protein [Terrimicrobiaceae bacterium]